MEMIMRQESDDDIGKQLRVYKKELNQLDPMSLAANIGINNINKYIGGGTPIKGTPWHVKGVHGYRLLLKELGIENKYEDIQEGLKGKVVYVKKNPYNVETITFYEWPEEFDSILDFDKEKMIDKFFVKKVRFLLNPIVKEHIIDCDMSAVRSFFQEIEMGSNLNCIANENYEKGFKQALKLIEEGKNISECLDLLIDILDHKVLYYGPNRYGSGVWGSWDDQNR